MEMAALGLDGSPHCSRVFLFPLGNDMEVGLDFEQSLKDQWEALRGGFLERQHFHVIIVEAKESAMAFEMGFAEVIVQKSVVFQAGERNLLWIEIESLLEDAKCFLLVEQPHGQKIAYLQDEALDFLSQSRLTLADCPVEQYNLLCPREVRPQFTERFGRMFRELRERPAERSCVPETLEQNHVVNREREKRI